MEISQRKKYEINKVYDKKGSRSLIFSKMQINRTIRCHFILEKLALIKKEQQLRMVRMWGKSDPSSLFVGVSIDPAFWKLIWSLLK